MTLFVDSSIPSEIESIYQLGVVSGVTTNPLIMAKEGCTDVKPRVEQILVASFGFDHPVSVQVTATTVDSIIEQALEYHTWNPARIVVKIPFSEVGLRATHALSKLDVKVNLTAIMSPDQACVGHKSGARYLSVFSGRIRDLGGTPGIVIRECVSLARTELGKLWPAGPSVIVGSIRHPSDVTEAFLAGANIVTASPEIIRKMIYHPRTDTTIQEFNAAWEVARETALNIAYFKRDTQAVLELPSTQR